MKLISKKNLPKIFGGLSLILLLALFRLYLIGQIPPGISDYEISAVSTDSSGPVYGLVKKALVSLSNILNIKSPSDFMLLVRTFSSILSVIAGFLFYISARKIFGIRVGLLVGFFWAILFPSLIFSRGVGPEALVQLLLGFIFFGLAHKDKIFGQVIFILALSFVLLVDPVAWLWALLLILGLIALHFKKIIILPKITSIIGILLIAVASVYGVSEKFFSFKILPFKTAFKNFFGLFITPGPMDPSLNLPGVPYLDILSASLLVLGLAYLASSFSKKVRIYFVLALLSSFIASFLGREPNIFALNLFYLPAVVLIAITFDLGLSRWLSLFPLNKSAKLFGVFFASIFLFVAMLYGYNRFFVSFGQAQVVSAAYHEGIIQTANFIEQKNQPKLIEAEEKIVKALDFLSRGKANTASFDKNLNLRGNILIFDLATEAGRSGSADIKLRFSDAVQHLVYNKFQEPSFAIYEIPQ